MNDLTQATTNPSLGILIFALGGLAGAVFYLPFKKVKNWAWESYWLIYAVFGLVVVPWLLALTTSPNVFAVLKQASSKELWYCYLCGAAWGLGEAIVAGRVTADSLLMDKESAQVLERKIADKQVMTVRVEGGTSEQPVPEAKRFLTVLADTDAAELTRLGIEIERLYQEYAQDVENFDDAEFQRIMDARLAVWGIDPHQMTADQIFGAMSESMNSLLTNLYAAKDEAPDDEAGQQVDEIIRMAEELREHINIAMRETGANDEADGNVGSGA